MNPVPGGNTPHVREAAQGPLSAPERLAAARQLFSDQVSAPVRQAFGLEPLLDVVHIVPDQIEARILIVPDVSTLRYLLLQSFEPGLITRLDVVAFPDLRHDAAHSLYRRLLGLQQPCHYAAGGRLFLEQDGEPILFERSEAYGHKLAGFYCNAVAAAILRLSHEARLSAPRVRPPVTKPGEEPLRQTPEEFFSLWLELFSAAAAEAPHAPLERFLAGAIALHREKSSTPLDEQEQIARSLRAMLAGSDAATDGL